MARDQPKPEASRGVWRRLLLVSLPLCTLGAAGLVYGALVLKQASDVVYTLLRDICSVFVAVALIHAVYEVAVGSIISAQVSGLRQTVGSLQRTVDVAAGAVDAGLAAVFATRREAIERIRERMGDVKNGETVRLLGISLGDYLCPHGALHQDFLRLLKISGVEIRALILDRTSDAALMRACREEPHMFICKKTRQEIEDAFKCTKCSNELKTATDFAKHLADTLYFAAQSADAKGAGEGAPTSAKCRGHECLSIPEETISASFSFKTYDYEPLCFLAIFEDELYLETYHLAGRGGEAPVFRIVRRGSDQTTTRLFKIYEDHFDVIWDAPRHPLGRGEPEARSDNARQYTEANQPSS